MKLDYVLVTLFLYIPYPVSLIITVSNHFDFLLCSQCVYTGLGIPEVQQKVLPPARPSPPSRPPLPSAKTTPTASPIKKPPPRAGVISIPLKPCPSPLIPVLPSQPPVLPSNGNSCAPPNMPPPKLPSMSSIDSDGRIYEEINDDVVVDMPEPQGDQ